MALAGAASIVGIVYAGISLYLLATQGIDGWNRQMDLAMHCGIWAQGYTLGGIGESILSTEPLLIFRGMLPRLVQGYIPAIVALAAGHFLMFLWMRPFRKIRRRRKIAINSTLLGAYVAGFYLYFCTASPVQFLYFYPFMLISIIGIVLIIRRWVILNRRAKRILRGVGLMLPFATLLTILLIPVLQKAFAPPAVPEAAKEALPTTR